MRVPFLLSLAALAAANLETALDADGECNPSEAACALNALQRKALSQETTQASVDEQKDQTNAAANDADARSLLNARVNEEDSDDMDLEKKYYKKQYKKGVQHYKKQYKKTTKHYKKQYKKATQHYKKAMKKAWYLQEEQEEGIENTHADARSLLNSRTEEESDDVDPWKKANKQYKKSVKKYDKNMKKAYKKGWYLQEEQHEDQGDADANDVDTRSLLNARVNEEDSDDMDLEKKYYKKQYKKGVQHYKKQYKKTTKHYKKQYKKATQHYKKAMKKAWYLQEEQEEGIENTHADARSLLNSRTEEESDDVDPWKKANKQYKKSVKKYDKNMKKAYKKGWYLQEDEDEA